MKALVELLLFLVLPVLVELCLLRYSFCHRNLGLCIIIAAVVSGIFNTIILFALDAAGTSAYSFMLEALGLATVEILPAAVTAIFYQRFTNRT